MEDWEKKNYDEQKIFILTIIIIGIFVSFGMLIYYDKIKIKT